MHQNGKGGGGGGGGAVTCTDKQTRWSILGGSPSQENRPTEKNNKCMRQNSKLMRYNY